MSEAHTPAPAHGHAASGSSDQTTTPLLLAATLGALLFYAVPAQEPKAPKASGDAHGHAAAEPGGHGRRHGHRAHPELPGGHPHAEAEFGRPSEPEFLQPPMPTPADHAEPAPPIPAAEPVPVAPSQPVVQTKVAPTPARSPATTGPIVHRPVEVQTQPVAPAISPQLKASPEPVAPAPVVPAPAISPATP